MFKAEIWPFGSICGNLVLARSECGTPLSSISTLQSARTRYFFDGMSLNTRALVEIAVVLATLRRPAPSTVSVNPSSYSADVTSVDFSSNSIDSSGRTSRSLAGINFNRVSNLKVLGNQTMAPKCSSVIAVRGNIVQYAKILSVWQRKLLIFQFN